ncbi:MAG: periplasmic heavy metal sensor [Bacteroidales bacterium]|nr:periplasmic heavy metal sensor [Bacteroidales bacterium]
MKKIIILLVLAVFALPLSAQHEGTPPRKKHQEVTELVKDLSAVQKRKVESISKDSRERVGALRKQQRAVRDSIAMYMEREGDQSRELFPLFDREAKLQVAVNREMYTAKLRIDEVLKPEQREALRNACHKDKRAPKRD